MIRVLIVDDEYIMRQGLRYMIDWEKEGYEIVGEAANGKDALELIAEKKPHIVISDIVMPSLDGVDFSTAVHHMYPQLPMIILSGYDNFEYVKQTLMNGAVDYILKPTLNPRELKEVLGRAAERIPGYKRRQTEQEVPCETYLERLLLGELEEGMSAIEEHMQSSYYCFYAVNVRRTNEQGQDVEELLIRKLERELQGFGGIKSLFVLLREELAVVLFGYEMSERGSLRIKLEKLNGQLAVICPRIYGLVSCPFTDFASLGERFSADIAARSDIGFYFPKKQLFLMENERGKEPPACPKFDFARYNRLLLGGAFREAAELLLAYHGRTVLAQMDVFRMKNQMKNMVYLFLDALPLADDERENLHYAYFKEIDTAEDAQAYDTGVRRIVDALAERTGQTTLADARMDRILAYIEENYREDLKLEDLVETFNFSYNYLSAFFNQQMNEGFNDYLNRIRIQKACELLEQSEVPIASVSELVGYGGHSYFCRVFKKYTGKTPSDWRREQHEK